MKMRMKLSVPKPMRHLSFLTILAGPDLTNLAMPNDAVTKEVKKVTMKRLSLTRGWLQSLKFLAVDKVTSNT